MYFQINKYIFNYRNHHILKLLKLIWKKNVHFGHSRECVIRINVQSVNAKKMKFHNSGKNSKNEMKVK